MIYADSDSTINPLNDFLKNYGIWIAISLAAVVFITVLILFLISLKKRKENPVILSKETAIQDENILNALGGKDNILSKSLNGSRIVLTLKNYDIVDEKTLNENGVDSIIKMSNKITLVSKDNSDKIYKNI